MARTRGFTLIELLVVISIIALLISILLPALGSARKSAQQMANSTQVRGIHQGMVAYASTNKGFYPGINGSNATASSQEAFVRPAQIRTYVGNRGGTEVGARFAIMMEADLISPDYAISPAEYMTDYVQPWDSTITDYWDWNGISSGGRPFFHSYALSNLAWANGTPADYATSGGGDRTQGRFSAWSDTYMGSQSPVVGDRLIQGSGSALNWNDPNRHKSLWSIKEDGGDFGGSVTFNDGHVEYSSESTLERTAVGEHSVTEDNLYFGWEKTPFGSHAFLVSVGTNNFNYIR